MPAGAAEPGGSFARTAIDELAEETGIKVSQRDLIPFGGVALEVEGNEKPCFVGDSVTCVMAPAT